MKINKRKLEKASYYLDYYFMDKILTNIEAKLYPFWLDIKLENNSPVYGCVYIKEKKYNDNEWYKLFHIRCSHVFNNDFNDHKILAKEVEKRVKEYRKNRDDQKREIW